MNTDVKTEWLAALRDPEAKQTRRALTRVGPDPLLSPKEQHPIGSCCLGVLCEVAARHGVVERVPEPSTGRVGYALKDGYLEFGVLPLAVRDWAGLGEYNPLVACGDAEDSLAGLNDGGLTFAEIADVIEQQL